MIRQIALSFYIGGFSAYAWRNPFISLCALLPFMAIQLHPDMPRTLLNLQGLSPWNILFANVLLAWFSKRKQTGFVYDFPKQTRSLLGLYFIVVTMGFIRLMMDPTGLQEDLGIGYLASEYFINCIKWTVPGLLLYFTCKDRRSIVIALAAILCFHVLLAIQVIKWMPLSAAVSGNDLGARSAKILLHEVGYHRINASMLLAGGSWAMLALLPLCKEWKYKLLIFACASTVAFGQALTAGRTGYGTWGVVGLSLCVIRWRRLLPLIPLTALIIIMLLPGVSERMLLGFGGQSGNSVTPTDDAMITSGRSLIWPYVIDKIQEAPILGYGRLAMNRTGLSRFLLEELNEDFPHPHNAYLEMLLDNGIVGFVLVIPFYVVMLWQAFQLLRDRGDPLYNAAGGVAWALLLALLVAAIGSQTFYPREGAVNMWAAIGVMLRVAYERARAIASGRQLFSPEAQGSRRDASLNNHFRTGFRHGKTRIHPGSKPFGIDPPDDVAGGTSRRLYCG
jgi:O-antigen ligase